MSHSSFRVGAAYYPDPPRLTDDARLFREAGFTVARSGDLIWDLLEPEEGRFTTDWLVDQVALFGDHGVKTFLATPTAAVPRWLANRHPDVLHVTADGRRKPFGKRRHACLNHPDYRRYAARIATVMAEALRDSPHVLAVQTDNELMAEEPYCYCGHCQTAFSAWLERRYGTVERLNEAWGLWFWSQRAASFAEVTLPRPGDNPSAYQAYQHFASDTAVGFHDLQRQAIHAVRPDWPVTHNICSSGFLDALDFYDLGRASEFLSIDQYPYGWTLENEYGNRGAFTFSPHMTSLALAQVRGAAPGKAFWVTEAQIGRTCGNQRKLVEPGTVRLWSLQELAHGADGICFFPWKPFAAGHEHVMGSVLDGDGVPRRRYAEATQVAEETARLRARTGSTLPVARACVVRDFRADWAFKDGRICMDFRPMRELHRWYRSLRRLGHGVDVVGAAGDFTRYDLIVLPSVVVVDEALITALEAAVARGATVVTTAMTGLRTHDVTAWGPLVHPRLQALAGIHLIEQHPLFAQEDTGLTWQDGQAARGSLWHDVIDLAGAEALATWSERFFAGTPVITRHQRVYHVGTVLADDAVDRMAAVVSAHLTAAAVSDHDQVEVTEVAGPQGRFVYLINFTDEPRPIRLQVAAVTLEDHQPVGPTLQVPARDAVVLRCQ